MWWPWAHRHDHGRSTAGCRPDGRRTATEIAEEFSTALLRGLIRDDRTRVESPLGEAGRAGRTKKVHA